MIARTDHLRRRGNRDGGTVQQVQRDVGGSSARIRVSHADLIATNRVDEDRLAPDSRCGRHAGFADEIAGSIEF